HDPPHPRHLRRQRQHDQARWIRRLPPWKIQPRRVQRRKPQPQFYPRPFQRFHRLGHDVLLILSHLPYRPPHPRHLPLPHPPPPPRASPPLSPPPHRPLPLPLPTLYLIRAEGGLLKTPRNPPQRRIPSLAHLRQNFPPTPPRLRQFPLRQRHLRRIQPQRAQQP